MQYSQSPPNIFFNKILEAVILPLGRFKMLHNILVGASTWQVMSVWTKRLQQKPLMDYKRRRYGYMYEFHIIC